MSKHGLCPVKEVQVSSLDEHHIIPREYGGEQGPTIWLSLEAHLTIHRCVGNADLKDRFLATLKPKGKQIAITLIQKIIESKAIAVEKQITTDKTVHIKIDKETYKRLKTKADSFQISVNKFILSIIKRI